MARIASAAGSPTHDGSALMNSPDWPLSLSQKLDAVFGDDEAVKCAVAANLSYFHDDPATLWWMHFAVAQGSYLQSGGRFVQGGSQRLSSALARAIRAAGGEVLLRRVATGIALDAEGRAGAVTHTAKDGSDSQTVECGRVIGNAAPGALAPLMPQAAAERLQQHYVQRAPSISLFAMTLGLAKPPREFGVSAYSTQLLPPQLRRLSDYSQGARLMAGEPGRLMPPMSLVDFTAIDSGIPSPPHVLSVYGPDLLSNWDPSDMEAYREKRGRWQDAIVR
jgi:phytoene dehydrogenase-like protein